MAITVSNVLHVPIKLLCMPELDRITRNPDVMGGKPCVRGMRVTVGTIVGLVATVCTHARKFS